MAMEARNVELEDKINSNKEKFDIVNERLNVLEEELAEMRKKIKALKDMDDEEIVMEAKIAELDAEAELIKKELGIITERQKVLVEELAELLKEMETQAMVMKNRIVELEDKFD